MAHFYGTLQGQAGEATRTGGKRSGIRAKVRSWSGDATLYLDHSERTGTDVLQIALKPENGYAVKLFEVEDYGALLRAIDAKDPAVMNALDALGEAAAKLSSASYKAA